MTRIALFDLDGTLIDSAPDLRAALNRLMAAEGLAPFSLPEVVGFIGDGARVLVERALAARGRPFAAGLLDRFLEDYTAHAAIETYAYPGISALLETLAEEGWRLAVCTNKPEAAAREVLGALGLTRHLAAIGGGDSFPTRKPDPAHLLATLAAAGGEVSQAIMIGDHHNDMAAARGAGVKAIFVSWGYGPPEMAAGAPIAADTAALLALLRAG
jgi:phosphoglycolate phosphatase